MKNYYNTIFKTFQQSTFSHNFLKKISKYETPYLKNINFRKLNYVHNLLEDDSKFIFKDRINNEEIVRLTSSPYSFYERFEFKHFSFQSIIYSYIFNIYKEKHKNFIKYDKNKTIELFTNYICNNRVPFFERDIKLDNIIISNNHHPQLNRYIEDLKFKNKIFNEVRDLNYKIISIKEYSTNLVDTQNLEFIDRVSGDILTINPVLFDDIEYRKRFWKYDIKDFEEIPMHYFEK